MNRLVVDFILLVIFMILSGIVAMVTSKLRVTRTEWEKPLDVLMNILVIIIIYLVHNAVLDTLSLIDPSINNSWIFRGLGYGFYISMLPWVYEIIKSLASTGLMVKLMHHVNFVLIENGVKSSQGYAVFGYEVDEEKGFCDGECAICLVEYETNDKCALLHNCGHTFHHKCLHESLAVSNNCPLCRQCIDDSEAPENKQTTN